ncbi:MAG: transposase [Candidatus Daviesbacteria bacterium]
MPGRAVPLVTEEIYHIFNRGVEKKDIFREYRDYKRFQQTFHYYQYQGPKPKYSSSKHGIYTFAPIPENRLVEIYSYCLMPNHFHFLVKQLKNSGISIFLSQLSNSYTKYFNTKYKRIGSLLQGTFKSVLVENEPQFLHLSRYIHINPVVSGLVKNLDSYPWSSYKEYVQLGNVLCSTKEVLQLFPTKEEYRKFLKNQIEYGETLELIKHQLLDFEEN